MAQALHLSNAPEVELKIADPNGRVAKMISLEKLSPERELEWINEICLVTVGRVALDKELKVARELFAKSDPKEAAEDFLWAMLNSYDFLFIQ